eukprot:gnl/MRDRNA2_/MRDRNA2_101371_c0_seq1.p1 gnl/MRDRNA2_/MRDRNA2_101371_c0~~gnl/MRDRNA2_/MRDRNA2_101371_c0_seq1.p1  ORF type:complete len:163 (+),score=10.95 gnl/MRDRNA2_/MRDRNA2_101371_c0_seq1:80-568(+)
MHKVHHDHLPEVRERRVFPFAPSALPSPAESRASVSSSRLRESIHSPRDGFPQLPYTLTSHGIDVLGERSPALRAKSMPRHLRPLDHPKPGALDRHFSKHVYNANHEFGHHSVTNDVNPFLAHHSIPKWQTTSEDYGVHYAHSAQTLSHGIRNRMPVFNMHV